MSKSGFRILQRVTQQVIPSGGGEMSYTLPQGRTTHGVLFEFTGGLKLSEILDYKVYVNNNLFVEFSSLAVLDRLQHAFGMPSVDPSQSDTSITQFYHSFEMVGVRTRSGQEAFAFGSNKKENEVFASEKNPLSDLRIEFRLASSGASSVSKIELKAEQTGSELFGLARRIQKKTVSQHNSAGKFRLDNIDYIKGAPIRSIYFNTNTIIDIEIWKSNRYIFRRSKDENKFLQNRSIYTQEPLSGFLVNPSELGFAESNISTADASDLYIEYTTTDGTPFEMYIETLSGIRA